MTNGSNEENVGIDGYLFRLIATFEAAAMQQLGKIAHPISGDVDVDLIGARDSIEMLVAIKRKTEGNLNEDERRLLDHVLYQLRMNYVDVASEKNEPPESDTEGSDAGEKAGGGANDAEAKADEISEEETGPGGGAGGAAAEEEA